MSRISRRTLIITLTETWTITWATAGDHTVGAKRHPVWHSSPVVPNNPKEAGNANLQASLSETAPGQPGVDQPAAPPTLAATLEPHADDASTRRKVSGRRRRRHQADSTQPNA